MMQRLPPLPAESPIQLDMERTMRTTVQQLVAQATRKALSQAPSSQKAQAILAALQQVRSSLTSELVGQAAKREAIQVAKRHAKAAAAEAQQDGMDKQAQALVARTTASRVALAFAKAAREDGLRVALDEMQAQSTQVLAPYAAAPAQAELVGMKVRTHKNKADSANSATAAKLSSTAKESVEKAAAKTEAVASAEAKANGLDAAQSAELRKTAARAVRDAAGETAAAHSGAGGDSSGSVQAAADADAYTTGSDEDRISLSKATDAAKKKALAKELAKYKQVADAERAKARKALEDAALAERKAAKFVDDTAKSSLSRGLDHNLSSKGLEAASEKATKASNEVEVGVKSAVAMALRQKERLKRANEKVDKAGGRARDEAREKNAVNRVEHWKVKQQREKAAKAKTLELKRKKEAANEAAHKAIVRVVQSAGTKASRNAARIEAGRIQQNFVTASCHRHAQHDLRNLALKAKQDTAARGLSSAAQRTAETKALQKNEAKVVKNVVDNTIRRQAHLSAMGAKRSAGARGLSSAQQLATARKAWKAASPKVEGFCKPAATEAAKSELGKPGQAPESINQHKFVVTAVQSMKSAVSTACSAAAKPLVKKGATLAAKHDADYDWQVKEGDKEVVKVCDAATKLYVRNAEEKSKEMVRRSFDESSENRQKSASFSDRIRNKAENSVEREKEKAATITTELMSKQCVKRTTAAVSRAKDVAAKNALGKLVSDEAKRKGEQAYLRAYTQAVDDGLGSSHAKLLGREAAHQAQIEASLEVASATSGLKSATTLTEEETMLQLSLLQSDFNEFTQHARHLHKQGRHADATEAQRDASTVEKEIQALQTNRQHEKSWVAAGAASELDTVLLGIAGAAGSSAKQVETLAKAISAAVKSLHEMGGRLPAEKTAQRLQSELHEAQSRIHELESRIAKRPAHHPELVETTRRGRAEEDAEREDGRRRLEDSKRRRDHTP